MYEPRWLRWLQWAAFLVYAPVAVYGLTSADPPRWLGYVVIAFAVTTLLFSGISSRYRQRWEQQAPPPQHPLDAS